MDSILTSIKKLLGISEEFEAFDPDVIMYINMALNTLTELGVGPKEGFRIESAEETWDSFVGKDTRFEMVRTYVFLKTKMVFDPPQSSVVMECYREQAKELEFRLNVLVDPPETFNE